MARIHPFQPYRYAAQAGPLDNLVTQPYDKIPDEMRERYLAASPYNFVRLIKGKPEPGDGETSNVYTRAAALLDGWIAGGILARDPEPAFYPYFQEFAHPETSEPFVRKAFICLLDLEEYENRVVHRHELTHSGPKLDRLRLTEATHAYFGQLFLLYDDPSHAVDELLDEAARAEPAMRAEEEGVAHKVWRIADRDRVERIRASLAGKKLLIADGHHRYETALAYARAHPEIPGAGRVMVSLVNLASPGLVVLATHRVLDGLPNFLPENVLERAARRFEIEAFASADALRARLDGAGAGETAIGGVFAGDERAYLFTPKPGALDDLLAEIPPAEKTLDVVVLHRALIGEALGVGEEDVRELRGIRYVRGFDAAVAEVRQGGAQAVFLLRPVPARDVAAVAFAGGVMPQKSTDFYPKLLSGFATYRFGDE